jgi:hypothetical protein
MPITNGVVTYGRQVKPADYENIKAEVSLSFALAEGTSREAANSYTNNVANRAMAQVHAMLNLPFKAVGGAVEVTETAVMNGVIVETAGPVEAAAKAEKAKRATKPKETPKADPAAIEEDPLPLPEPEPTKPAATVKADPAAIEDLPSGGLDEFAPLPPAAVVELTDEVIISAMTRTNARVKNPVAIRQIVGSFVAFPKQARDIPQAQRQAFLDQLAALQPATK